MGLIKLYKDNFLQRQDKDPAIPYYSHNDFPNLIYEENSFTNSLGIKLNYFFYSYKGYDPNKIVFFCHGLEPGHTAYLTEIELLCKSGYKVLTMDYTGCGSSEGEALPSINRPAKDVIELLDYLKLKEEIVLIGHSLGGYTALSVINQTSSINKAVIISGFVTIASEMLGFVKLHILANVFQRYENKLNPDYKKVNNWKYLKKTNDKILFFHSTDDTMVKYKYNTGKVAKIKNPCLRIYTYEGKKHNPNYSKEGLEYMNMAMGGYYQLLRDGGLKTLEERKQYFADKPIGKMTDQDKDVWKIVLDFIKE